MGRMHGIVLAVNARRLALLAIVPSLFAAAPAFAQTPPVAPPPAPPAAGKASIKVKSGLATAKVRYVAPQQEVLVRGRVTPAVPGEVLTLYAIRGKKASKTVRRKVKAGGRYEFRFKVGNAGGLRLVVKHAASATQVAFRTRPKAVSVVELAGRSRRARRPRCCCSSARLPSSTSRRR